MGFIREDSDKPHHLIAVNGTILAAVNHRISVNWIDREMVLSGQRKMQNSKSAFH